MVLHLVESEERQGKGEFVPAPEKRDSDVTVTGCEVASFLQFLL